MKRMIIEFLGTLFLVLAFAVTSNPLAVATMLMAWIYIGASVSGAHYNPVVSFATALAGKMSWQQCLRYICAQVLGGLAAYSLALFLVGQVSIPTPNASATFLQAFIVEVLLAFVFALVVLVVMHTKRFRASTAAGFVIGFTIPALGMVGGPISGGLFNPAISVGANLLGLFKGVAVVWKNVGLYVAGGLLGAFVASYVFHHLIPDDER